MDEISNSARYVVTDNCRIQLVTDKEDKNFGKVKILTGKNLKKEVGANLNIDKRFNLAVCNSTLDLEEYFNYYILFLKEVENLIVLDNPNGAFVNQLDMGYIPVFAPPTYLSKELIEKFREGITKTGVEVIEKSSMRLDGTYINTDSKDLWCSRFQIAKLLDKHPCAIKIMDYLQILIPYLK